MDDQTIKILSVEDNPGDARLLQEVLKSAKSVQFEWLHAANLADAVQKLAEVHFDVILLDLSLPDSFGLATLAKIRERTADVPIVIMTGLDNEQVSLDALGKGAQDYLVKGQVDSHTLSRVIRYAIQRKQVEDALRDSEERYVLAVKGSNDGVWDWNLKANQVYYSARWKEILGYSDEEIGDSPEEWMSRVHEEDIDLVKANIQEHLKNLTPYLRIEYRMLDKQGNVRWVLTQGLATRDAQGASYRMAGSQTDVTDRKQAEEKLIYNAFHDPLTGLPNRLLFISRLERALQRLERVPNYLFAVLFLDLDRFKIVNDSLGHALGDELLVSACRRLEKCVRKVDTLARIGGDEFLILSDHIKNVSDTIRIAERIRAELENPFDLGGHEVFTRASIGIAVSSLDYKKPEEMIRDADTAMYYSKSLGGGNYRIFDRNMHVTAVELLQMENNLRRAVNDRDFVLHYQPVIALENDRILGLEALIRWQHPERGLLMPSDFIPLAEETALVIPMGAWVLKTACEQLSRWQKEFHAKPPLHISINVSYKQFAQADFIDMVDQVLQETGIEANSLCLEITESGIMKNPDLMIPVIDHLKKLRVQIHLDDFGTGYSSLHYLHRFKVDALKIDRSFVSQIHGVDSNFAILKSVVSLAHNLKMNIIAEGIETDTQLDYLRGLKCQYGQGYLFSRPKDAESITRLIANNRAGKKTREKKITKK